MAKHGCFSINRGSFIVLNCSLLIASSVVFSGCAGTKNRLDFGSREEEVARKLRRAHVKIENLKERNQILRMRLKMLTRNGAVSPLAIEDSSERTADPLKGFEPGLVTDVSLDARKPVNPPKSEKALSPKNGGEALLDLRSIGEKASKPPIRLPAKKAGRLEAANIGQRSTVRPSVTTESIGEQADRVLLRTMMGQLKSSDISAAERTLRLLEKSYPESQVFGEARFQMGLFHYRQRKSLKDPKALEAALRSADFHFAEALRLKTLEPRVQAGSALMRGVIARLILLAGGESRNREIARQNFEYVMKKYPKTMEARRARREMVAMDRRTL